MSKMLTSDKMTEEVPTAALISHHHHGSPLFFPYFVYKQEKKKKKKTSCGPELSLLGGTGDWRKG